MIVAIGQEYGLMTSPNPRFLMKSHRSELHLQCRFIEVEPRAQAKRFTAETPGCD